MPWLGGDFSAHDFHGDDFDVGVYAGDPDATTARCAQIVGPDICPTLDDCHAQILAALPRGRAWATDFGDTRWRFWRAVAECVAWINARICAAREEFFCATMFETSDIWARTYAFPDVCDPYARICDKVAATGGQTCAYLVEMAGRIGFAVDCGAQRTAEADCAEADCAEAAPTGPTEGALVLRVHAAFSPALGSIDGTSVEADLYEASQPIRCGADLSSLRCLMDRIAPAHLQIIYIID